MDRFCGCLAGSSIETRVPTEPLTGWRKGNGPTGPRLFTCRLSASGVRRNDENALFSALAFVLSESSEGLPDRSEVAVGAVHIQPEDCAHENGGNEQTGEPDPPGGVLH